MARASSRRERSGLDALVRLGPGRARGAGRVPGTGASARRRNPEWCRRRRGAPWRRRRSPPPPRARAARPPRGSRRDRCRPAGSSHDPLVHRVAILADEHDAAIVENREGGHGAPLTDHLAQGTDPLGLLDLVHVEGEHAALVDPPMLQDPRQGPRPAGRVAAHAADVSAGSRAARSRTSDRSGGSGASKDRRAPEVGWVKESRDAWSAGRPRPRRAARASRRAAGGSAEAAVSRVARHRVAEGGEVHPDLVGAARMDAHVQQRGAVEGFEHRPRTIAPRARGGPAPTSSCDRFGSRPMGASTVPCFARGTPRTRARYSFSTARPANCATRE